MSRIIVRGGQRLRGTVEVNGAKNAVLPLLAASLLMHEGETTIDDVPRLTDVRAMCALLRSLGADVCEEAGCVRIAAQPSYRVEPPRDWVQQLRASFLLLGPLLARQGEAVMPLPGGCAIGMRPIDQHIQALEQMGAQVDGGTWGLHVRVPHGRLRGAHIRLDVVSVGATQNALMAAVLADGTTTIDNAACEPEITDLVHFLQAMGAVIHGVGTSQLTIVGVDRLVGVRHRVIPDRIEAGTLLLAAAITRGRVYVRGAWAHHLQSVIMHLEAMGVTVIPDEEGIWVHAKERLRPVDVVTAPYPGFPTDLQAPMMALLSVAQGPSVVQETVFENRFQHVASLRHMHAQIEVRGDYATIVGTRCLHGATVEATDLRAAAALLLAALVAEGETTLTGLHHLDRGYMDFVSQLHNLGADIHRFSEPAPQRPAFSWATNRVPALVSIPANEYF